MQFRYENYDLNYITILIKYPVILFGILWTLPRNNENWNVFTYIYIYTKIIDDNSL